MKRESSMADRREYVRVSVSLPMNPKLGIIDDPAVSWLYVVSLCHCGEYLTDGIFIGSIVARKAGVPAEIGKRLVSAGMWHEEGHDCPRCVQPPEGQLVIHDYLMHQRSKDQAEQVRTVRQAAANSRWAKRDATRMQNASGEHVTDHATGMHVASDVQCKPDAEVEVEVEVEDSSGGGAASQRRRTAPAPPPDEVNAGHIVAKWIEGCRKRPPSNIIGQMSRHVRVLLEEGFDPEIIQEAIHEWKTKDVHPSVLPSIVNSIVNGKSGSGRGGRGRRESMVDVKARNVGRWQEMKAREEAEQAAAARPELPIGEIA